MQVLIPTNAPYWIIWNTPDTGFILEVATNLNGPWGSYDNCASCPIPLESLHASQEWTLILPQYLPTANGVPDGPPSPNVFFQLTTAAPPQ